MINEAIGWLGAALFAICALPQVVKTFKTKKADDFIVVISFILVFWRNFYFYIPNC